MKYTEFDNVEGRQGGPYLDELELLTKEKKYAEMEGRTPNYVSLGFKAEVKESTKKDK
jgi:hypothetical protein